MIEKIEVLINDNTSEDYWYDVAIFSCQEIIKNFSDLEWNELSEKLGSYSEKSKIRVAECLADIDSDKSIPILLKLSNTESHDLFITCIDLLRDMDMSSVSTDKKLSLLQKVKSLSSNASELEKTIIRAFRNAISG